MREGGLREVYSAIVCGIPPRVKRDWVAGSERRGSEEGVRLSVCCRGKRACRRTFPVFFDLLFAGLLALVNLERS